MNNEMIPMIKDLAEQFKDKENLIVLVDAIDRQFEEICEFFNDLKYKRSLQTAIGKQLDVIGQILDLSRVDACKLANININSGIDDELYRKILGYKIMMNTGGATYYDIVRGIKSFCNIQPIRYFEDESQPATIILEIGTQNQKEPVLLNQVLPVAAGGVKTVFRFSLGEGNAIKVSSKVTPYVYTPPLCGIHRCGTIPQGINK